MRSAIATLVETDRRRRIGEALAFPKPLLVRRMGALAHERRAEFCAA